MVKKSWLSVFVENEIGVLARVSGLFSSKSYNLDSLTVGVTEDATLSRMTISLTSDDQTFEQVKKQLNRCVEVVKVIDLTDTPIHMKELMFVKIHTCSEHDMTRLNYIREIFNAKLIDYDAEAALLECVQPEQKNNDLIRLLENHYPNRLEIVRGGSVAMEAVSISDNTV